MFKRLIILLLLTGATCSLCAQVNNSVRTIEVEPLFGINLSNKIDFASTLSGFLGVEIRLNYPSTGWDVGLQFSLGAMYQNDKVFPIDHHIRYKGITTFVDYNYRRWKNIAPFAGLGIGAAFIDDEFSYRDTQQGDSGINTHRSICFAPRVGVEFFRHYRLTFEYRYMQVQYSTFNITLGVAFGGGYKKK